MADKSFHGLQTEVDEWIRTVGVRYFSELTNTAILTEEVGEVARLMARLYGEQSFKKGEEAGTQQLAEEMADVLFVLICLANQTGVDLAEAFEQTMDKRTNRDGERHASNPKLR
ncbi:MAG TPA: nucleotide pyrophosphohydrolase [Candidatus Latescibacteria bacterium]|nr:nucleotide pyrophosphohydrolase [Candidatus Latescibacterota bacterium]HJP33735.1 nucleotide pyrophosphohydrolase [Candidatus Latescibacterota bacterium]